MRIKKIVIFFCILSPMLYSCFPQPQVEDIYFPVQKQIEKYVLGTLLQGELTLKDGCIRVRENLIIWPYGFSLKMENGKIWIIDGQGEKYAAVGDRVQLGGGEIPAFWAEEKMGHSFPANYEGPYFLVGNVKR